MKNHLLILTVLLFAVGSAFAQLDPGPSVLAGTDRPTYYNADEYGRCLVYTKYVIKTVTSDDGGENITAYASGTESGIEACNSHGSKVLSVTDSDNNSFNGILGDYLFIDMGTSAGSRNEDIFDLTTGTSVISIGYYDNFKLSGGRYLVYDAATEKKGNIRTCKQAAEWKRNGGGVQWVQGMKYDLETKTSTVVGGLRCAYAE